MDKQDLMVVSAPQTVVFKGAELKYPSALLGYATARAAFWPTITETYNNMLSRFDSEVGSIEDFVDNGRDFFTSSIRPLLSFAVKEFASYNCYLTPIRIISLQAVCLPDPVFRFHAAYFSCAAVPGDEVSSLLRPSL